MNTFFLFFILTLKVSSVTGPFNHGAINGTSVAIQLAKCSKVIFNWMVTFSSNSSNWPLSIFKCSSNPNEMASACVCVTFKLGNSNFLRGMYFRSNKSYSWEINAKLVCWHLRRRICRIQNILTFSWCNFEVNLEIFHSNSGNFISPVSNTWRK